MYDNVRIGLNSRLDTIQAAILSVKLKAFKEYEVDAVNKAADRYTELLKDTVKTPIVPDGFPSQLGSVYYPAFRQRNERQIAAGPSKTMGSHQ